MDVFISYSSKEFEKASFIRGVLQKNSISVWMAPESIPAGSNYTKEIPAGIRGCKVFLLLLSNNAQNSSWVSAELENAFKNQKPIIPFMIENCVLKDEFDFLLSRSQRIDAYEKLSAAMENLIRQLKTFIGIPAQTQTNTNSGTSSIHQIKTHDGSIYEGAVLNGLPHGKGKRIWTNGDCYDGDWLFGDRTGKGTYTWANGDIYQGDFVKNARTGIGKLTRVRGKDICIYEGSFQNGVITGHGKMIWVNEKAYEGNFANGKPEGQGKMIWDIGDIYEGNFADGRPHGFGKLICITGYVFEGQFNTGSEALGKWVYADGTVRECYETVVIHGDRLKKGKMSWADGTVYEGHFFMGSPSGPGKMTWADGRSYTGNFDDLKSKDYYRGKSV